MQTVHDDPLPRDEIASGFAPRFEGGRRGAEIRGHGDVCTGVRRQNLDDLGAVPVAIVERDGTVSVRERR